MICNNSLLVMTSLLKKITAQVVAGNFPSRTIERRAIITLHQQHVPVGTIAWFMGRHPATIVRWCDRFSQGHVFDDRPRPGAQPKFDDTMKQQIFSFYTQTPPPPGCRRWTLRWAETCLAGHDIKLDHCTLMRILHQYGFQPHKRIDFMHLVDPDFFPKTEHIISVYKAGHPYLFCFDECPCLQAITRDTPDLPGRDGSLKIDSRYHRHGTTDLIAFMNYATGHIFHRCTPNHDTQTLIAVFTEHVQQQPADAPLHYICDNLYPHFNDDFCQTVAALSNIRYPSLSGGQDRREWLQRDDKRIAIHFIPFHSSWLNMIESWFSVLKSHCLRYSWFDSVAALRDAIMMFIESWNQYFVHPFTFRYDGIGLQESFLCRFTRLLCSRNPQVNCKFLTNQLRLVNNVWTDYHATVPEKCWDEFYVAFRNSQKTIVRTINADDGPVRRKRAEGALGQLNAALQPYLL
jgi:transposase